MQSSELFRQITRLNPGDSLEELALQIARYQYKHNPLYHNYADSLKIVWDKIDSITKIPFLPIRFFKSHEVKTGDFKPEAIFTSSATTGDTVSKHHLKELRQYEEIFSLIFESNYGSPAEWAIFGLLPSYLERTGSSLVVMVDYLIQQSRFPDSGFFMYDHDNLVEKLKKTEAAGTKALLIGVTFALLDFAAKFQIPLEHTVVMETGGMKGRGLELTREEVAIQLKKAFGVTTIHSEYGMTELMSQAYSPGHGVFTPPPWLKMLVRDTSDPLESTLTGSGALNIIDLANVHTCCFIATQDLGKVYANGDFEVTGRMDRSDIRGCNLMVLD